MSMGVVVGDLLGIAEVGSLWDREDPAAEQRACGKTAGMGKVTGKRRGEIGEAAFLAKVSALGFGVAKTWGDSDRYDFVVDGGAGLWRVQVKSAHRAGEDGGYNFHAHGHTMVPYRADEIDALVAYVLPEDAWYVFPVGFFAVRVSMNLFPASQNKRSKFEKYREAWWILRGEVGDCR